MKHLDTNPHDFEIYSESLLLPFLITASFLLPESLSNSGVTFSFLCYDNSNVTSACLWNRAIGIIGAE
jgi:hypothetical protein